MRLLAAVIVLVPTLAACNAREEAVELTHVVQTPLTFDPTDAYDLDRWWSNGRQMLRLDPSGGYVLYGSQNRYEPAAQRGTWFHTSYVVLELEPYTQGPARRTRVEISKRDGELVLTVPDHAPMTSLDGPPPVLEDELIGAWEGPGGRLLLQPDLRYAFSPSPRATVDRIEPAIVVGHSGTWISSGKNVLLQPYAANIGPYTLDVTREEGRVGLAAGTQPLVRVEPKTPRAMPAGSTP